MHAEAEEINAGYGFVLLVRLVLLLLFFRALYFLRLLVFVPDWLFLRKVPNVRLAQPCEPGDKVWENCSDGGNEVCVYFLVKLEVFRLFCQVRPEL